MAQRNIVLRFLSGIWRGLDGLRRFVHLLLMLLILVIILAGLATETIQVPERAALVISPSGTLVEQLSGSPLDRALSEIDGQIAEETLVRDVVEALDEAADDERIDLVVLALGELQGGGLSKLQAVGAAIDRFRDTGKEVLAMADGYTQAQYYLAARADKIYMHELGFVFIEGFGYFRTYFRSALDKLRVDANVFRVGEYKSFVEPFTRDDMSEEDKEAASGWLTGLWLQYQNDIAEARDLSPGALDDYANRADEYLSAVKGDTAQMAVEAGLVDELLSNREFRDLVRDRVGADEEQSDSYASIGFQAYLQAVREPDLAALGDNQVAVIVAAGEIVDGDAPPGTVGSKSLANLVRQAATEDKVKAVVLRVDSPGGSMLASENILDELEGISRADKPLIASMSSVAASGGYYISMPADEIWANESTITGSIGVGAIFPTIQRGLGELGINVDGFGTTDLSGQLRADRELGEEARELLQLSVESAYRTFVSKVAETRDLDERRADGIARGRVWLGRDARQLDLIDEFGDLDQAIASAASRAGLVEGDYSVRYLSGELSFAERIAEQLSKVVAPVLVWVQDAWVYDGGWLDRVLAAAADRAGEVDFLTDPRGLYLHCFCEVL